VLVKGNPSDEWVLAVDPSVEPVAAAVLGYSLPEILELPGETATDSIDGVLDAIAQEARRGRDPGGPHHLIVTVPIGYGSLERAAVIAAAAHAGLPDPAFLSRPAAAARYLARTVALDSLVAVADVRDASIDIAVLERVEDTFELAGPPVSLSRQPGEGVAASLRRHADALRTVVASAGVTPGQIAACYVIGDDGSGSPVVTEVLGIKAQPVSSRRTVAVRGSLTPVLYLRRPPAAADHRRVLESTTARATAAVVMIILAAAAVGGIYALTSGGASPAVPSAAPVMLYVLTNDQNAIGATVLPINTTTNTALAAIPVGGASDTAPTAIAISPDGKTVYVATESPTTSQQGAITLISTTTGKASQPIPVGQDPEAIAVAPDGETAYVANMWSGTVTPIYARSGTAGPTLAVGGHPSVIAFTPDGKTVYVVGGSGSITSIDAATGAPGPPVAGPEDVDAIAMSPDSQIAYAAGDSTLTAINTATNVAGRPITEPFLPQTVAVTPDGSTILALAPVGNVSLTAVTAGYATARTIPVNATIGAIVISRDSKTIYALHMPVFPTGTATVSVVDLPAGTVREVLTVPVAGRVEDFLALTPDGKTLYLAGFNQNTYTGTIVPVNTATGVAGRPIAVTGGSPAAMVITESGVPRATG